MNRWRVWTAVFTAVLLIASGGAFARNSDADEALFRAAKSGSVEAARAAIQAGADANVECGCDNDYDHYDWTPLHFAVQNGNVGMVKMLLDAGADVNTGANKGSGFHWVSLQAAIAQGNAELVEILLQAGARVNALWDYSFGSYLHYAAAKSGNVEIVKALIRAGANVNAKYDGWTPLMLAARCNGNIEIVKVLINAGADVNATTEYIGDDMGDDDEDWPLPEEVDEELYYIKKGTSDGERAVDLLERNEKIPKEGEYWAVRDILYSKQSVRSHAATKQATRGTKSKGNKGWKRR